MSEKYKNKYRIKSARHPHWNYGSQGIYFITICTKDRHHFFDTIKDGKMILNGIGALADKYWLEIPQHFPFAKLGESVVMPDDMHGILIIDKKDNNDVHKETSQRPDRVKTLQCNVSYRMGQIPPKPGSISTIIRSYKSVVTKNARYVNPDFG